MKQAATRKVGIYSFLCNSFLLIIKTIFGLLSHSQALLADAANSAGDIISSFLTIIGNKISSEPSDESHNLGHGKAEYLFSLLISILMIFLAINIIIDAIHAIIDHQELIYSLALVITCSITIFVKLSLYIFSRITYNKTKSFLIMVNMKDSLNDIVITSITLFAILFSKGQYYWLDGVTGIVISLWIFNTGYQIFKQSYNILMDISIDEESKAKIAKIVASHKAVWQVGQISTIPLGSKFLVVLTIYVDAQMQTIDSHAITLELAKKIKRNVSGIDRVIIHVNPIAANENNRA
ncbi:MAG TPA: cation diffusion facilitator family transporter [Bacilli bacterium]|nr:cation diffusion facilitator family transporter [Bacilli bacterium]